MVGLRLLAILWGLPTLLVRNRDTYYQSEKKDSNRIIGKIVVDDG